MHVAVRGRRGACMSMYLFRKYSPLIILVCVFLLARIVASDFFNSYNLSVIFTMTAVLGFLALAETIVIFTRGFDLSVGSVASLSTVIVAAVMLRLHGTMPDLAVTIIAVLISLVAGLVMGSINGFTVVVLKIPPFIGTLGGMWIATGFAFLILRGVPTGLAVSSFKVLGNARVLFFSVSFLILVAVMLTVHFFIRRTSIGVRVYAAGGNDYAAYLS